MTPLKKPVLRGFALFLSCSLLLPSPAYALRKQQVEDSPVAAALLLSGLEEAGPYQAYRIPYTNTGAASQEVPPSVRGKAVYSGFTFFDTAKSSQAPGALVLLIDFQRFVSGHFPGNKHQQDRNYVAKMTQRFFFGHAPDIQAIVFYNAPERVMDGISGLWAIYQFNKSFASEQNWLVQKPLWAIPGSIRVPDQLTVSLQVEVADLNTATVSVGSSAGMEEPVSQRSGKLSRRRWLAGVAAAGLGAWWLTREPEERFLEPEEVPAPWKQLFEPKEGAKPLPFLGEDYFRFQISSRHLDAGYRAFDRDGKELGSTDATTRGDYQRIVDPRTGATLGYYRMPVQWSGLFGIERFVLSDSSGGDLMTVSVYPYTQGGTMTKGVPPEWVEGVPSEWRNPERLKTETERPIYRVFEDEKHQVTRVEMIGYVETTPDRPGRLLDVAKRPIARLEPVQIIYAGQNPQTFQPLDTALASRPGNNRYFTEAPSEKLAQELSTALRRFQPATAEGKSAKLQLAHRWVQLQVLLGKRTVAVDSKKAQETGEALVKRSTAELEDFENPEVRRLLWDAVANFHPWFAMAREAVRHLNWEEDPEILRYVLSQIQQWWIELENPKQNALANGDGRMTDLTKDLLEEVLLYNGFQTLEDVTDGFKSVEGAIGALRLSREFLYIDRPQGSDPALVPLSLMQARLKGFRDVSDVQILLHQAVALQRLGYEVSFLSYIPVANGLEKEEPVKTLSHEWVIMATHPDPLKEAVLFSAHREFLKRFGEEISPGVTRVTRERLLEVNQTLPPGFYLSMEEYSLFPLDALAYLKARDQALKRRKAAASSAELLGSGLGLAVESEGELHQQFGQDLASVYVKTMAQRFDEIVKEMGIEVVTSGLAGSELEVRKAGYGAALGLIPRKLIKGLEKIVFLRETEIIPSREARVENGRVIWENVDLEAEGTYLGKVIKSVKGVSTPIHELIHHWDLHVTNQIHDWRGDLSELFHQISWQRNNGQGSWALRKTADVDMRDFAQRAHGLANEREDIAVNGERYVMDGAAARSEARIAMSGGNYAPAVKYLFAKYLLFLDTDGTSFEYGVGDHSPSITWSEVAAAIRSDAEGLNPKPEAKRLGALVERMREVWQKQRESKSIVQRAEGLDPLLAAAGVEEETEFYQRLIARPEVLQPLWDIVQSAGRFLPGNVWGVGIEKEGGQRLLPLADLIEPNPGEPVLRLFRNGKPFEFFPVQFRRQSNAPPSLRDEVYVFDGHRTYLPLSVFLETHIGLKLDQAPPGVNPFITYPTGFIAAHSQEDAETGYDVVQMNRFNFMLVDSARAPVGIENKPDSETQTRMELFPPAASFAVVTLPLAENDPPFETWYNIRYQILSAGRPRPQIAFKPSGEGRLYLPRREVDWDDFLPNHEAELGRWYEEHIALYIGRRPELKEAILEWEKRLEPYFIIAPVHLPPAAAGLEEMSLEAFQKLVRANSGNPRTLSDSLSRAVDQGRPWKGAFIRWANNPAQWGTLSARTKDILIGRAVAQFAHPGEDSDRSLREVLWQLHREPPRINQLRALLGLAYLADDDSDRNFVIKTLNSWAEGLLSRSLSKETLTQMNVMNWILATLATERALALLDRMITLKRIGAAKSTVEVSSGPNETRVLKVSTKAPERGTWILRSDGNKVESDLPNAPQVNADHGKRIEDLLAQNPSVLREFRDHPQVWRLVAQRRSARHPFQRALAEGLRRAASAGVEEAKAESPENPENSNAARAWIQEAKPGEADPSSLRGKAMHFDYMNIAFTRPGQVNEAVALLIDFDRFQQGLTPENHKNAAYRAVHAYAKQVIRFLGNLPGVQAIIFYNAPSKELVVRNLLRVRDREGLNQHWQWLMGRPLWVLSEQPVLSTNDLLVDVAVQVRDKSKATVSFGPAALTAAGVEEGPKLEARSLRRYFATRTGDGKSIVTRAIPREGSRAEIQAVLRNPRVSQVVRDYAMLWLIGDFYGDRANPLTGPWFLWPVFRKLLENQSQFDELLPVADTQREQINKLLWEPVLEGGFVHQWQDAVVLEQVEKARDNLQAIDILFQQLQEQFLGDEFRRSAGFTESDEQWFERPFIQSIRESNQVIREHLQEIPNRRWGNFRPDMGQWIRADGTSTSPVCIP
ncbi:MAG: hypothetical protein Q7J69_03345 [Candidatus Omnitrophota bacterium]|nr:hypothetical protein [Candidatus Omnitrophota bacterium]